MENNEFDTEIKRFFHIACEAIREEDQFLRQKMRHAEAAFGFYSDYHHGVSALFETTLVHLVVRKLLAADFPMAARWEDAYPGTLRRVDLVLQDRHERKAAIEFKFWKTDDASDLLADKAKLATLPGAAYRRLLFAVWREPENEQANLRWLESEKRFKCIACETFPTHFRGRGRDDWTCVMALLEPSFED